MSAATDPTVDSARVEEFQEHGVTVLLIFLDPGAVHRRVRRCAHGITPGDQCT